MGFANVDREIRDFHRDHRDWRRWAEIASVDSAVRMPPGDRALDADELAVLATELSAHDLALTCEPCDGGVIWLVVAIAPGAP